MSNPTYSSLKFFHGYGKDLPSPTTIIILPLKTEKVEAVRKQPAEIHPEVLLFLHKIKKPSVQEACYSSTDCISAVSIYSEAELVTLKRKDLDCILVHLSVQKEAESNESTCACYT